MLGGCCRNDEEWEMFPLQDLPFVPESLPALNLAN